MADNLARKDPTKQNKEDDRPIITIIKWIEKHHANAKMNYMLHHVEDFSKCDLSIFLKVESFQAAPLAETIRKVFEKNHCFVISDYDTVLVHLGTKESYDIFLELCEEFIPNFSNQ